MKLIAPLWWIHKLLRDERGETEAAPKDGLITEPTHGGSVESTPGDQPGGTSGVKPLDLTGISQPRTREV